MEEASLKIILVFGGVFLLIYGIILIILPFIILSIRSNIVSLLEDVKFTRSLIKKILDASVKTNALLSDDGEG